MEGTHAACEKAPTLVSYLIDANADPQLGSPPALSIALNYHHELAALFQRPELPFVPAAEYVRDRATCVRVWRAVHSNPNVHRQIGRRFHRPRKSCSRDENAG